MESTTGNSLLLGSHISLNKQNKYLLGVVEESIRNGANTFMIFTGAPHNKKRVPIEEMYLQEAVSLATENGINFKNAVVHAPYIINLANPVPDNEDFNVEQMVNEVARTASMGIPHIVLHPGYHVAQTREEGIERLIKNLKKVLQETEQYGSVTICLETMPGKRNQLGSTLQELRAVMEGCGWHSRLGLCLDTVHLHDSGYDVVDRKQLLKQIDDLMGLDRIKVLHLGDSSGERGCRRDRHANFEYGKIGFKPLVEWAYDPLFRRLPIIVETPFWISNKNKNKSLSPYRHEIRLIRQNKWEPIPDDRWKPR